MRSKQILIGTGWLCLSWSSVALADEGLLAQHQSAVEDVGQVRRLDSEHREFSVGSEPRRAINSTAHTSSPLKFTSVLKVGSRESGKETFILCCARCWWGVLHYSQ